MEVTETKTKKSGKVEQEKETRTQTEKVARIIEQHQKGSKKDQLNTKRKEKKRWRGKCYINKVSKETERIKKLKEIKIG